MTELNALFDSQRAHKRNTATEVASLLATWQRLRSTHLPVSFGCSCGTMGHVRAEDFEKDVLDYLNEKHAANTKIIGLLQRSAKDDNRGDGGIGTLLKRLHSADGDAEASRLIVADLRRSIGSWSSALGPRNAVWCEFSDCKVSSRLISG